MLNMPEDTKAAQGNGKIWTESRVGTQVVPKAGAWAANSLQGPGWNGIKGTKFLHEVENTNTT